MPRKVKAQNTGIRITFADNGPEPAGKPWPKLNTLMERKRVEYLANCIREAGQVFDEAAMRMVLELLDPGELLAELLDEASENGLSSKLGQAGKKDPWEAIPLLNKHEGMRMFICNRFTFYLELLLEINAESPLADTLSQTLPRVATAFGLDELEQDVLLYLYLQSTDGKCAKLLGAFAKHFGIAEQGARHNTVIAAAIGRTEHEVAAVFGRRTHLLQSALITERELAPEVVEYLQAAGSSDLWETYFTLMHTDQRPMECLPIEQDQQQIIQSLVQNKPVNRGIHILVYGGSTLTRQEMAFSLVRHLGCQAYMVCGRYEERESKKDHLLYYRAFQVFCQTLPQDKSVIIFERAESLLGGGSGYYSGMPAGRMADILTLMDKTYGVVFWLAGRTETIDEPIRVRFDFALEAGKPAEQERKAAWSMERTIYQMADCLDDTEMQRLATTYEAPLKTINLAVSNACFARRTNPQSGNATKIIDGIMQSHARLNRWNVDDKDSMAPAYTLEGLNIKPDLNGTLKLVEDFNRYWLDQGGRMKIRNMNMLLSGPPGSGKTEFVKYLARKTNRKLVTKRASDLLNMYLGATEERIRDAFTEAEREKAILFVDEADSLLRTRETAVRSWEVTHVNEFLTNMERFRGMFICATNFVDSLDAASLRRFSLKLEFDYLRPEGVVRFYEVFLQKLATKPLADSERRLLMSLPRQTPGNFKVVYERHMFSQPGSVGHAELTEELGREVAGQRTVGFV